MLGSTFDYRGDGDVAAWLIQRFQAIGVCLDSGFPEAALALMYSAIDTLAFLGAPTDIKDSRREDFIQWCDQYIVPFPSASDSVAGIDLYGARCGVLHQSSAVSRLGRQAKAREIWYEFKGQSAVNPMLNAAHLPIQLDVVMLFSTLQQGASAFLADLKRDSARLTNAEERGKQLFAWGVLTRRGQS
jgi:hypothetical protein